MQDTSILFGVGMLAGAIFFIDGWGPSDKSLSFMKSRRFRGLAILVSGGIISPVLDHVRERKLDFLLNYLEGCLWGWLSVFVFCGLLYISWKSFCHSKNKFGLRFAEFLYVLLDFIYLGISDNPHLDAERKLDLNRKQIESEDELKRLKEKLDNRKFDVPTQPVGLINNPDVPVIKIDEKSREMLEAYYKQLIETKPEGSYNFYDWYYKGLLEYDKQKYDVAIDSFKSALLQKGGSYDDIARANQYIAMAYTKLEKYNESIETAKAIITLFPKTKHLPDIYDTLAFAFYYLKQYNESLDAYIKIISLVPESTISWFNKGVVMGKLERYNEELSSYEKAIDIQPDYLDAWYNKGFVLNILGRFDDALAAYNRTIEIQPDYVDAWNNKGTLLTSLTRYDEALIAFDQALTIQPDSAMYLDNKGNILGKLKKYDDAFAILDRAIELQPDYYSAWFNKGIFLIETERYQEGIEAIDRGLKVAPDDSESLFFQGIAFEKLKSFELSIAAYDKAIKLKPDYMMALSNKSFVLGNLSRYEEALTTIEKAIELEPDNNVLWFNKACLLSKSGDQNAALGSLKKAIELDEINKKIAATDEDLVALRNNSEFKSLIGS